MTISPKVIVLRVSRQDSNKFKLFYREHPHILAVLLLRKEEWARRRDTYELFSTSTPQVFHSKIIMYLNSQVYTKRILWIQAWFATRGPAQISSVHEDFIALPLAPWQGVILFSGLPQHFAHNLCLLLF